MTGTSDWRQDRWERTHRRLFTTAIALFEQYGFEQVSVSRIAAAAELSVPTFYAHYPSKEHLIMALPTTEEVGALLAGQPADLPVAEQLRRATPSMFAAMSADEFDEMATRWRIIARTPALRIRAAEFASATAGMVLEHLPGPAGTTETVRVSAALAAYTVGMLAWADSEGERTLPETLDEAFRALSA